MMRIFFLALLLLPFISSAQTANPIQMGSKYYEFKNGVRIDSALFLPRRDTGNNDGTLLAPGEIIYRNADSLLWYRKGNTMVPLVSGGSIQKYTIDSVISTVTHLALLSGREGEAVIVKDVLRGGLFYWTAIGTIDNGVTFSGATGFWNRVIPGNWVDAAWWGAIGDGIATGVHTAVNNAINYCVSHQPKTVILRSGHYLQNGAIRIKDSIHLKVDDQAVIELLPNTNQYQATNDDLINGNRAFKISGGRWVGNGQQQTMDTTGGIPGYYLGFQWHFYKCTDFKAYAARLDSFFTWSVAFLDCHDAEFSDLYFRGYVRNIRNGGGVQGSGTKILIRNIAGYSDDDLVAVLSTRVGFSSIGFPGPLYPTIDCDDFVVENIRAEKHPDNNTDSAYCWRAVRIFSNNNHRVTNVIVQNVSGITRANPVHIDGHIPVGETSAVKMENIQIRNITCKNLNHNIGKVFGYVGISNVAYGNNISISGITRRDSLNTYYPMVGVVNSSVKNLDISNVEGINIPNSNGPFLLDSISFLQNVNLNNIYWSDSTFSAQQPIYRKFASASSTPTHINGSNIRVSTTSTNGITTNNAAQAKISLNSTDFRSDTTLLVGQDRDQVYHLSVGPFYYLNGKWNGNGAGSFIQNQTTELQTPANYRISGVGAANRLRLGFDTSFNLTTQTKLLIGFTPTNGSTFPFHMNIFKDTTNQSVLDSVGGIFMARIHNNVITTNTTANGYGYTRAGSTLGNVFGAGADSTVGAAQGRISITAPVTRIGFFAESDFTNHDNSSASIRFYTKALGAGGTLERLRIAANGNVGIGETNPATKLHVNGTITAPSVISPVSTDLSLSASSGQRLTLNTSGLTRVAVKDDGTIDVGSVIAPFGGVLLNVGGNIQTNDAYILTDGTTNGELGLAGPGLFLRTVSNHPLQFRTNDTERMRILGTGQVGIGTVSPATPLQVVGSITGITEATGDSSNLMASTAWVKRQLYGSGGGGTPTLQQVTTAGATTTNAITVGSSATAASIFTDAPINSSTARISFRAGGTSRWLQTLQGTESGSNAGANMTYSSRTDAGAGLLDVMTLQRTGNVGIGNTAPTSKLDVTGKITATGDEFKSTSGTVDFRVGAQTFVANSGGLGTITNHPIAFATNSVERVRLTAAGDFGIGTTTPGSKLAVNGAFSLPALNVTTNTTLDNTHFAAYVNTAGGEVSVSLPSASSAAGRLYVIKKTSSDGNNLNIFPSGGALIEGATQKTFNLEFAGYILQSDGTNWWIISRIAGAP